MNEPLAIRIHIEEERSKLYQMQIKYDDFSHPKVIQQSVLLDELINKYNQAFLKERRPNRAVP